MRHGAFILIAWVLLSVGTVRANVTLLLEEPYGTFGFLTPTGHAAVYLSRVCAASPLSLRRCRVGEHGVVISRYHRVSGHDWIAIPLLPYLYAVDRPADVPAAVSPEGAADLRDAYRRRSLQEVAPDAVDGGVPQGQIGPNSSAPLTIAPSIPLELKVLRRKMMSSLKDSILSLTTVTSIFCSTIALTSSGRLSTLTIRMRSIAASWPTRAS